MSQGEVLVERRERLAIITLNAPERLNALTTDMGAALDLAFVAAATDPDVRAIMLTGAGRGFCAGASMDRLEKVKAGTEPLSEAGAGVFSCFADAPPQFRTRYTIPLAITKPVIAAVNGPCAGAGLMLALACDIRIASTDAKFVASFARMGLVAESSSAFLLGRIAGHGFASDMLLSARRVDADEALARGLVTRLAPAEGFRESAVEQALQIARETSPRATRLIKSQLQHGLAHDLVASLDMAERSVRESLTWPDLSEGISAVREKRSPSFPDP